MQIFFSLPMSLMFIVFAYEDGDLTLMYLLQIFGTWILAGAAAAFVGWHVILPSNRRRSGPD